MGKLKGSTWNPYAECIPSPNLILKHAFISSSTLQALDPTSTAQLDTTQFKTHGQQVIKTLYSVITSSWWNKLLMSAQTTENLFYSKSRLTNHLFLMSSVCASGLTRVS